MPRSIRLFAFLAVLQTAPVVAQSPALATDTTVRVGVLPMGSLFISRSHPAGDSTALVCARIIRRDDRGLATRHYGVTHHRSQNTDRTRSMGRFGRLTGTSSKTFNLPVPENRLRKGLTSEDGRGSFIPQVKTRGWEGTLGGPPPGFPPSEPQGPRTLFPKRRCF